MMMDDIKEGSDLEMVLGTSKREIILNDIEGTKTPTHLILKLNKRYLKSLPDKFFVDITIHDFRDAKKVVFEGRK